MNQHSLRYIFHIIVYIVLIALLSLSNLDFVGGLFLAAYFHKTSGIYGMKLFIIAALVFVIPLVLLYFCTDFSSIPNPWFAIILIILVTILGVLLILILKKIGFIRNVRIHL